MVNVSLKEYYNVLRILVKLSKRTEITSENIIEAIKKTGIKLNNSSIRHILYKAIDIGLVKAEPIFTGSMSLGTKYYVPERYNVSERAYIRNLAKKLDTYINGIIEREGEGFFFKCNDCSYPLIPVTEVKCPVCGSQNLSIATEEDIKKPFFDFLKNADEDTLVKLASIEIEKGIGGVYEYIDSILKSRHP